MDGTPDPYIKGLKAAHRVAQQVARSLGHTVAVVSVPWQEYRAFTVVTALNEWPDDWLHVWIVRPDRWQRDGRQAHASGKPRAG